MSQPFQVTAISLRDSATARLSKPLCRKHKRILGGESYENAGFGYDRTKEREKWRQPTRNEMKKFEQKMLQAHNHYRAYHMTAALEISRHLSSYAIVVAQNFATRGVNLERIARGLAINSHTGLYKKTTAREVAKKWYKEHIYYNFDNPRYSKFVEHFVHMLSPSVKHLGVGLARKGKVIYIVVLYDPWVNNKYILPHVGNMNMNLLKGFWLAWKKLIMPKAKEGVKNK